MAGLQQYNFFPTDLFYPRPQPSPATLESASAKPPMLPLQTPNAEIITTTQDLQQQEQQKTPRSLIKAPSKSALVSNRKKQSVSLSGVEKKQSKFSANPLSWMVWIEKDDGSDNF